MYLNLCNDRIEGDGGEFIDMVFVGTLFIIIGAFYLLRNLGIISADLWSVFWPTIIIIIGIRLLIRTKRWDHFWKQLEKGRKIEIE